MSKSRGLIQASAILRAFAHSWSILLLRGVGLGFSLNETSALFVYIFSVLYNDIFQLLR